MYISIVHDYYSDTVNFKRPQTSDWDKIKETSEKKLFQRVDSRQYVRQLEQLIMRSEDAKTVEALEQLRSQDKEYRAVHLDV